MDRRQFLFGTVASAAVACRRSAEREPLPPGDRASAIERLLNRRHELRLFHGEALVAETGRVIYRGGFGLADRDTKQPYTADTRSCLASLSKPITAVAVMMLVEQEMITFDSQVSQLLPGFSAAIGGVTVRQLLTHTSGVPDYPDLGVDHPGVTNAEILAALRRVQDPVFAPGLKYQYSNSGYVLLGSIVERVSATPLPQFLAAHIFGPLGMTSTFVLTSPAQKTAGVARGYDRNGGANDFEGMTTGDGGVYSTVNDLLRFDQALYGETLLRQQTLALAFTPAQVREGSTTYGLGWNIAREAAGLRVWHQGNTAGFRAFIERRLWNRITVIMLTNGGDTNRMAINDDIQRILLRERV